MKLTEGGARVLLVSTDPACDVGQVFEIGVGHTITAVTEVPGLDALEIDPEAAAEAYRQRIVGPVGNLPPPAEISAITEQLSGSCTTEKSPASLVPPCHSPRRSCGCKTHNRPKSSSSRCPSQR